MRFIWLIAVVLSLSSCSLWGGEEAAVTTAIQPMQGFYARSIDAPPFSLVAYEKIRSPGQVVNLYIGGEGDEVGIAPALAREDLTANVVYLTRPCQNGASCADDYRGGKRYGADIVDALSHALDVLKAQHKFFGFNLIGFSSGATLAALVAAERDDIVSLRTVAGLLDVKLDGSLNPVDAASRLLPLPQKHFIGAKDTVVPHEIGDAFIEATGRADCLSLTTVDGVDHLHGWAEAWPGLLEQPLEGGCTR